MKLNFIVGSAVLFCGFAASAHTPVEQMTCAHAQAYAEKHGMYWKDAGPDGQIPIYPVYTLEKANCGGRTMTSAQMEQTLDVDDCIVGWYCRSY